MVHIMVDLETLSTDSNAVILTIGAIPFSGAGELIMGDDFYFYECVDLKSYNKYKNNEFSFNWDTLIWWLKQEKEPREEAFLIGPRHAISDVLQDFVNWIGIVCKELNDNRINIWSHGKDFDVVVLENGFKVCNIECPWKFWDTRDTRTLYALAGVDMRNISVPAGFKAHNAVGDCFKQIEGVRQAFNNINRHISQSSIIQSIPNNNQKTDEQTKDQENKDNDRELKRRRS